MRIVALVLLLLAASPLTEPFSTLDLTPAGDASAVDTVKTKKQDEMTPALLRPTAAVAVIAAPRPRFSLASPPPLRRDDGHAILRR